jgi:nitroimidazol reductase NimA-like FMN-containing flavoprotein (pyridoxamine 5'-phosphate oxidase superfamily)
MIEHLTNGQIEEVLKDNVWGHLGCNDGLNTYVYPFNYLYDGKYITCHSQRGFKTQVMRQNNRVCLQVDEVSDDNNWKSVMVLGKYQEVEDELQYNDASRAFADRRFFPKISESSIISETGDEEEKMELTSDSKPVIFRIVIDEKIGRFENE